MQAQLKACWTNSKEWLSCWSQHVRCTQLPCIGKANQIISPQLRTNSSYIRWNFSFLRWFFGGGIFLPGYLKYQRMNNKLSAPYYRFPKSMINGHNPEVPSMLSIQSFNLCFLHFMGSQATKMGRILASELGEPLPLRMLN